MLFEKRLGGSVYRPIGTEWATKGYWKVYDHPATIEQFLGIGGATPDGSAPLNEVESVTSNITGIPLADEIGINIGRIKKYDFYHCKDIESGQTNKAITFEVFMKMDIDIVIASIPQHIEPFRKLANQHPNKPKVIYQIGNSWNINRTEASLLDGVLSSAKLPLGVTFNGYNGQPLVAVEYHQEFDLDTFSSFTLHEPENIIRSFVNCFSLDNLFAYDWALFQEIEKLMPEWKFETLGGQCRDGAAHGSNELSSIMRMSKFIWHTKAGGDGYGHVLHNSAAVGRPLIIRKQYYQGKMGEALIKDGETAIVIDGLSTQQIIDKILYYSEPDRYQALCKNVRDNFNKEVDFDKEYLDIKQFLENIV